MNLKHYFFGRDKVGIKDAIKHHKRNQLRGDARHTVDKDVPINILVDNRYEGKLIDFSISGISFKCKEYLARKNKLTIEFTRGENEFANMLKQHGFSKVVVEVKWGTISKDKLYYHGAKLSSLNVAQKETLSRILTKKSEEKVS